MQELIMISIKYLVRKYFIFFGVEIWSDKSVYNTLVFIISYFFLLVPCNFC